MSEYQEEILNQLSDTTQAADKNARLFYRV